VLGRGRFQFDSDLLAPCAPRFLRQRFRFRLHVKEDKRSVERAVSASAFLCVNTLLLCIADVLTGPHYALRPVCQSVCLSCTHRLEN